MTDSKTDPARTLGAKLEDNRLALVEALALNHEVGLTKPSMVRITKVPSSTAHRLIDEFVERDIVVQTGKEGKAGVYRLNSNDSQVVEMVRALRQYTLNVARLEAERHGYALDDIPNWGGDIRGDFRFAGPGAFDGSKTGRFKIETTRPIS